MSEEEEFDREEQEAEVVTMLINAVQELNEDYDWDLDDILAHVRSVIRSS